MENKDTSKLSLRERYKLKMEVIKSEIGDLERIRLSLGLSQRRVCQLLMVDPSAWTRWLKTEAPPHVYQSLQWALELKKMNPEFLAPHDFSQRMDLIQNQTEIKLQKLEESVAQLERMFISSVAPSPAIYQAQFEDKISALKNELEGLMKRTTPKKKKASRKSVAHQKQRKIKSRKYKVSKKKIQKKKKRTQKRRK